jgi:putative ABC transport system permease protein
MLLQDFWYALRSLWHSKAFAAVAIACLGFGIGVNTTIFSIVDGVLLKPMPYADPDHLLSVGVLDEHDTGRDATPTLSYLDLRDWRDATTSFSSFGALSGRSLTVVDGAGDPERYTGAAVSWDLFPTLGIAPAIGHGFTPEDDQPTGGAAVLLSDDLWQTRYQADRSVIGHTITVNALPRVVVGVMPPGFKFPNNQKLWIPLTSVVAKDARDARGLLVFGRLKPGVTNVRAAQDVAGVSRQLAAQYPTTSQGSVGAIRTLREVFIPSDVMLIIWMMMAGVTLVLFIACSNVANLLLARATGRRRELSVRAALGAGRRRIIRQLLTESVVLSLLSVPIGVLIAEVGTRLIAADMPVDQVPYYIRWEVDWRSLAYTLVVALATALAFGVFPALQASGGNLHDTLKEGTRGNSVSRSPLRSALVVVQIALALVALVGALLFVRSFQKLDGYDLGFDTRPLMTMRFYMPGEVYDQPDAKVHRVEDIVRRVEALPSVEAAFASNLVPIGGGGGGGRVIIDGRPVDKGKEQSIAFTGVTPHFYQTLGIGLTQGRNFTDMEAWSRTPVAIISRSMAKRFWPGEDPLGKRFQMPGNTDAPDWFTVIGVAPDIKQDAVNPGSTEARPAAYVPYNYQQTLSTGLTIRVHGDPASITGAVRAAIRASDPNLPLALARTMEDVRRLSFWQFGLFGWIFGVIGAVGLLLASIGVYGVMSYSVSQRTQEIGVRVALGASRSHVVRLVVGHGLILATIGVGVGLLLAPVGTWIGRSQFYGVSPFDPLTFIAVCFVLVAVAFVASYLPALRATHVDPVVALRGE